MATADEIQYAVDRVQEWEPYFEQAPPPEDMTEESFPIVDVGVSSEQWKLFALSAGTGILDRGGRPFWLKNLTNATNSATLTVSTSTDTGEAIAAGFYYKLNKDLTVSLPMPTGSTSVKYHVGLLYDPTREADPAGPIRAVVLTQIDDSGGKVFIPCWEVTRRPNELLTNATVVQKRPKIAPTLTVDSMAQLPRLRGLLWGTRVILTAGLDAGKELIASGASTDTDSPTRWDSLTNPPWNTISLSSAYEAGRSDQVPRWRIKAGEFQAKGVVKRKDGKPLARGEITVFGWATGTDLSPQQYFDVGASSARSVRVETARAAASAGGAFDNLAFFTEEVAYWFDLTAVRFELENARDGLPLTFGGGPA